MIPEIQFFFGPTISTHLIWFNHNFPYLATPTSPAARRQPQHRDQGMDGWSKNDRQPILKGLDEHVSLNMQWGLTLKTESRNDANFVVTGGSDTTGDDRVGDDRVGYYLLSVIKYPVLFEVIVLYFTSSTGLTLAMRDRDFTVIHRERCGAVLL